ncbi:MAG: succinyl-diaminopimelate desuccinylase, partial [Thermoproteota archaeon]
MPDAAVSYAVELLGKLISIPTVNPPGSNYENCARLLGGELDRLGFEVQLVEIPESYLDEHYPYAPAHRGYPRFIVLGRLGSGRPILHFNGHYDVVPPGTGWARDPFTPAVVDGKVYG